MENKTGKHNTENVANQITNIITLTEFHDKIQFRLISQYVKINTLSYEANLLYSNDKYSR